MWNQSLYFPLIINYLSISSTNSLSDIGKAKLNRTLLSSSKVTKPSPRLSNATKARVILLWFSNIYKRNKIVVFLFLLSQHSILKKAQINQIPKLSHSFDYQFKSRRCQKIPNKNFKKNKAQHKINLKMCL